MIKSSSLKVEMMCNKDKDGSHPLSKETCFLDVTFKQCKGWPTYALSYYNKILREMVKLATMECEKESEPNCALFLGKVNEMVQSYREGKNRGFNPFHIQHDEHGGNPIGISSVLGEDALSRTSSCEFHYNDSAKKHRRYVLKGDRRQYEALLANLKNAVTNEAYNAVKSKLQALIDRQSDGDRKPLHDALSFWDKAKHRWAKAFRPNLHCDFTSSLAEVAHASMVAGGDVGGSLVDAAIADTADGMRLVTKWENRSRGEVHSGTGPSGLTLASRNARQQEARADKFINETKIDRVLDPHLSNACNTSEGVPEDIHTGRPDFDPCRTHVEIRCQAKCKHLAYDLYSDSDEDSQEAESDQMTTVLVGRKRQRSLTSKTFVSALKRAEKLQDMISLHHIEKNENQSIFKVREDGKNYTVTISNVFKCSCPYQLAAKKRTCSHILWCFLTVLKVSKDNPVLAQLEVGNEMLQDLLRKVPDTLPEDLLHPRGCNRTVSEQLRNHPKYDDYQEWFIGRKTDARSSRCSGCLKKAAIVQGELHLFVKCLLQVKDDKIVVTTLRFYLVKDCVVNIKSSKHNIRPLCDFKVKKDPFRDFWGPPVRRWWLWK